METHRLLGYLTVIVASYLFASAIAFRKDEPKLMARTKAGAATMAAGLILLVI